MPEEEQFAADLQVDLADPVSIGKCLQRLANEISATKFACQILTGGVMGVLAALDALDDESRIRIAGPARKVLRESIDKAILALGPHPLLLDMRTACGRDPFVPEIVANNEAPTTD